MSFQAAMASASSASGSRVQQRQRATNSNSKAKSKRLRAASTQPAVATSRWTNSQHQVWRCPGTTRLGNNSTCDDSHDVKVRWCGRCWSAAPDATDEERDEAESMAGRRFDASLRSDTLGQHAGNPGASGYQHEYGHADPDSDSGGDGSDESLSDRSA